MHHAIAHQPINPFMKQFVEGTQEFQTIIGRTKNPAVVRMMEKEFGLPGMKRAVFTEESEYEGGTIYAFGKVPCPYKNKCDCPKNKDDLGMYRFGR